jgi:sarcosine oxidase subunit delta
LLRIDCPWCGTRDETEFRYRGDASVSRPADASPSDAAAAVYERANPLGWHREYWLHAGGCRQVLVVERHTLTHAIQSVAPVAPLDSSVPAPSADPADREGGGA